DVFQRRVRVRGEVGHRFDRAAVELHIEPFDAEQLLLLLRQRVAWLGEDADEIVAVERREFDADREAALQFGHQVAYGGGVKRAGRDEKNVARVNDAVPRVHRGAFDDRQQVALHALARDVRAAAGTTFTAG